MKKASSTSAAGQLASSDHIYRQPIAAVISGSWEQFGDISLLILMRLKQLAWQWSTNRKHQFMWVAYWKASLAEMTPISSWQAIIAAIAFLTGISKLTNWVITCAMLSTLVRCTSWTSFSNTFCATANASHAFETGIPLFLHSSIIKSNWSCCLRLATCTWKGERVDYQRISFLPMLYIAVCSHLKNLTDKKWSPFNVSRATHLTEYRPNF